MSVKFTDKEKEVLRNIISGVESGSLEYGKGDYAAFTEAYENSSTEHAITLGKWQAYGPEAHELVARIRKEYPSVFKKFDTANIAEDLASSVWSNYQISRNSDKAKCIINIISSPEGKKCQEEQFDDTAQKLHDYVYSLGITDHQAIAMASNWACQGGLASVTRILKKTNKPYNLDNLYAACQTDTNPSYVGYYKNRQRCVYNWIKQYWPMTNNNTINNIPTSSSAATSTQSNSNNNSTEGGNSMAKTYPAGYLSNSGHDENYKYTNGQAGDNTGTEWELKAWYSYPWSCVLRHPNAKVRALIAELAIEAALNNNIGYDQYERTTFWYQLAKSGYHPKNIAVPCEADCSAGVAAICKAVGYLYNDSKMKNISIDSWTGIMRSGFRSAGFEVLTASKYLNSSDYLVAGDILLNDEHHVCTCISSGTKSGEGQTSYDGSSSNTSSNEETSLNTTVKSKLYVKKNNTPLRTWAGSDESQLISYPTVNKNQELGLCDAIKADDGSTWYFVKINDKYGFVDSNDVADAVIIDTDDYKPSNNSNTVTVDGHVMTLSNGISFNTKKYKWTGIVDVGEDQTLNLRTWPNGDLLKSLPKVKRNTKVYVLDAILDKNDNIWLYVKVKNPTTAQYVLGFAFAKYIKAID